MKYGFGYGLKNVPVYDNQNTVKVKKNQYLSLNYYIMLLFRCVKL
jgi:hypothetical protein